MKGIFSGILILLVLNSCAQKNKKVNMNAIVNDAYEKTPKHAEQPMYGLQIDKMGCRLSVLVNDETLGDYFEKGGYSNTATINGHIIASGTQEIKVIIYPREGMQFIDDLAHVQLQVFYVRKKGDPMDTYQILKTLELPKDLKDKKLPYFEIKLPFEAKVPWDYTAMYNGFEDLRKVPDIEKKVIAAYEKIRELVVNNEQEKYLALRLQHKKFEYDTFYMTKAEIKEYNDWIAKDAAPLQNKEVAPIKNYELVFEKEGKRAFLRDRTSRGGVIKIDYGTINTEGDYKGQKSDFMEISPALVIPKGKTEFECL